MASKVLTLDNYFGLIQMVIVEKHFLIKKLFQKQDFNF